MTDLNGSGLHGFKMFIQKRYNISSLTSYDLLKSLALFLMVIDHVGYFFFPENEWFRVIGRASMPIWFFLVGYARGREIPRMLWVGALALIASNIVLGGELFPLNVLVSIMFVRLVVDKVSSITFRNWEFMMYGGFLVTALSFATIPLFEYGTIGLLIAMSGYLARNSHEIDISERTQRIFMGFTVAVYTLSQLLIFRHLTKPEAQAMTICIGLVSIILYYFRPTEVPEVESKLPRFAVLFLQFTGRFTLEIYVIHLILFKLICCLEGWRGYGWFNLHLIG